MDQNQNPQFVLLRMRIVIFFMYCVRLRFSDFLRNVTDITKKVLGGADAVDFRTQTKIKIYSFNFKDPSRFNFVS